MRDQFEPHQSSLTLHNKVKLMVTGSFNLNEIYFYVGFNQTIRKIKTHLSTEKTRAIFPIARILFLITSFLTAGAPPEKQTKGRESKDNK